MIEILKALADETRLRILAQMLKGDMCVCELEACLDLTQSNASRHLTLLKNAGILESYKIAQWSYYKISTSFMVENSYLYQYLKTNLTLIEHYELDNKNYAKCKKLHLCNNKNNYEVIE